MIRLHRKQSLALVAAAATFVALGESSHADSINPFLYKGSDRKQVLIEGAKKEGKVLFYSGWVVDQVLRPMVEAFHQTYPFVDLQYVDANNRVLFQKLATESKAGVHFADVIGDTGIAEPMMKAGLAQPFYSPAADSYPPEYKSPDGFFVSANVYFYGVAYNTNLVSAANVPDTYEDLIDPKWQGKMVWPAVSDSGAPLFIENILMTKGDKDGEAYLKSLSANQIVNYSGSARAMVDRIGQGEYELGLASFAHHPILSKMLGAPLDVSMIEPIPTDINTILAPKAAPHPYAAMLLIDFILSQQGETILRDAGYFPARPDVEPVAAMRRVIPQLNNWKVNVFLPETVYALHDRAYALFDKYFK